MSETKIISYITKENDEIAPHDYEYDVDTQSCAIADVNFLSFSEIVKDLPNRMTDVTLSEIKETSPDDLIKYHMTLGMWIRNNYGLWQPENPHIDGEHPDDYSFRIIEEFHATLNNNDNFDQAMEIVSE